MQPLLSQHPLIVYVDVKSPYAYLAIEPTLALAAALGIAIDWRPLTLNIGSYLGTAKTNAEGRVTEQNRSKKQWHAVRYAYMDAKRYARMRGISLYGTQKIWDSSLAGIGILWAAAQGQDAVARYLRAVYPPFWQRALNIEDVSVIRATLEHADVDVSGFEAYALGAGRALHDELQVQLHPAGIYGVPTYVADGEILFGREHLPAVRWLLTGRQGTAPDTAYESAP